MRKIFGGKRREAESTSEQPIDPARAFDVLAQMYSDPKVTANMDPALAQQIANRARDLDALIQGRDAKILTDDPEIRAVMTGFINDVREMQRRTHTPERPRRGWKRFFKRG